MGCVCQEAGPCAQGHRLARCWERRHSLMMPTPLSAWALGCLLSPHPPAPQHTFHRIFCCSRWASRLKVNAVSCGRGGAGPAQASRRQGRLDGFTVVVTASIAFFLTFFFS